MKTPLCSIIIRSFNEEKHIGRLLEGIHQQSLANEIEIILVDSGSTDATVAIAKENGATILHIQPDEFSFGRALNYGCTTANGKFLLFASAHVYPVYTNWIEQMLAPFANEKIALVYGRQIGNEITKYAEHQVFKKWFPEESNDNQQTPFCNNANAVIRKCLWQQQAFDESLTGLEDIAWAAAIQQKGYGIAYNAKASIVHVHEESFEKIKNRYRREAIALKIILPKEHISFFDFLRLSMGNIMNDAYHALHDGVFFKHIIPIIRFRVMQFWGTYLGFTQKGEITTQLRKRFYYPNTFKRNTITQQTQQQGEKIMYSTK